MWEQIGAYLLNQGPVGVVCVLLLLGVRRLFGLYEAVQERRIAEARESIQALNGVKASLDAQQELIRTLIQSSGRPRR